MKYHNLKRLGMTELKKRLIKSSTYWNAKNLKETCDKIKANYSRKRLADKRVMDFLIIKYIETPGITVKFPENYYK